MKKLISILLLSTFLLSQIGHHLVYTLATWNAKKIVSEHLKSNIIDEVVERIPANENMHWESKDTEFELAGKMYDVVKKESSNNKIIYYCINDENESSLLQIYTNWIQSDQSNDAQKQHAKAIFKYVSIECEMPIQLKQDILVVNATNRMFSDAFALISGNLEKVAPPPKHFS